MRLFHRNHLNSRTGARVARALGGITSGQEQGELGAEFNFAWHVDISSKNYRLLLPLHSLYVLHDRQVIQPRESTPASH